jgi:glycosyltransferase involved in cell wall biosynthesis
VSAVGAAPARPEGAAPPGARVRVAATADYYLPGFKGGGALRSVAHMAEQLADALEMHVVTRDRDLGDQGPYPGVPAGWTRVAGAPVRYLSPAEQRPGAMARALREARPEVLYLNSAFSPAFTLLPLLLRRAGRIPRVPVVLAPRGELSEGALSLKRPKKVAFLRMARATGLYRGVLWQASSELEAAEIRRWFGAGARVLVAPDLRERPAAPPPPAPKRPGELRAAFLSRITGKKNLAGALEMLAGVRGRVRFTVYGPVEDAAYWERCRALIAGLPENVRVEHAGPLPPGQVNAALAAHHLFLFPTLGENFGHVVLEALLAGLPVLTSDRTPWGGLEAAGAGWALPLEQPERFAAVLQAYTELDGDGHAGRSAAARAFGEAAARDESVLEANRALFREAVRAR